MTFFRKNILITGASRGLGSRLAEHFSRAGANLILVSRDVDRLAQMADSLPTMAGQEVNYFPCDFSDQGELSCLIDELKNFELDAVINNAAIQGPIGALCTNNWLDWRQTIQVNLLAPAYICQQLIPSMLIHSGHKKMVSIINLSGGGATGPRANFTAYAAAKSGLIGFSASLAEELRNTNIRVNTISPGVLPTDMLRNVIRAGADAAGYDEINSAKKVVEEGADNFSRVCKLCEFLISDKSKDINGKVISAVWDDWEDFARLPLELLNSDLYTMRRIVPSDRTAFIGKLPMFRVDEEKST